MVNINITQQELLVRTQTQLAQVTIERNILDERLNACASIMTPEQLEQVGMSVPRAKAADAPATETPAEAVTEMAEATTQGAARPSKKAA